MAEQKQAAPTLAQWLGRTVGEQGYGQHLHGRGYRVAAKVGKTAVVIDPAKPYGFSEHDDIGYIGELGGLWFDAEKRLQDYDGVFSLSLECAAAIEALGYTLTECCVDEAIEQKARKVGGFLALAKSRGLAVELVTLEA